MTLKDVKEAKIKAKYRLARKRAGQDRLTMKDLESAEKEIRGLSLDALRDLGKGASNKGSNAIDQYIIDRGKARRRVKPGDSKMKGFSMGGVADYIKELL